jgi:type II secretory pathway pseudopilin PulG
MKSTKYKVQRSNGTTLIEVLLYVGIVAIISTALVQFALTAITSATKSTTQQEVSSVGRSIARRIQYEIRNASDINSISATQISLVTKTPSTNPTVISLSGGNVTIKQGTGSVTNLNSSNTTISSFTFTDYSSSDTKTKHIEFQFDIQAAFGSSGRQEYTDALSFASSAEVRNR